MDWQSVYGGSNTPGITGETFLLLIVLVLWTLIWKGMALWKAAQEKSKVWFVVLLVINTVGILDILYLYVFNKKSNKPAEAPNQI